MPSPTESTRPISATFASVPKPLICSLRIAEISAARTSMCSFLSGGLQCETQRVQLGFDGSVELAGADAHDEPAYEAVIDAGFGLDLGPELPAQSFDDGG